MSMEQFENRIIKPELLDNCSRSNAEVIWRQCCAWILSEEFNYDREDDIYDLIKRELGLKEQEIIDTINKALQQLRDVEGIPPIDKILHDGYREICAYCTKEQREICKKRF